MSDPAEGRSGVLAAGNWIVDHVKLIDTYPEEDALAFIGEQSSANGGGPYNLLKDLAKLGAEFPLCGAGLVGDDADGQWIFDDCAASGIDTTRLRRSARAPTSYTDVMSVAATGRRTFFHQPGANALLGEGDIDFQGSGARYFYLGYLLLLDTLDQCDAKGVSGAARLLARARDHGFETVVDLVSAQGGNFAGVVTPSLPQTDTLFMNEFEAAALLGHEVAEDGLMAAAEEVLGMGVRQRVVAHCEAGAVLVARDGTRVAQGAVRVPPEKIRGAAGAGDAFAAGVVLGLHGGMAGEQCLLWGVCSAASCLGDPTTSAGLLPLEACLEIGKKLGFRDFP